MLSPVSGIRPFVGAVTSQGLMTGCNPKNNATKMFYDLQFSAKSRNIGAIANIPIINNRVTFERGNLVSMTA